MTQTKQEVICWKCKKAIPIPNDFNITHFCPECETEFELGRIPSFSYFTSKVSKNCWIKRVINNESEK